MLLAVKDRVRSIDWLFIRTSMWWLIPIGFFGLSAVVVLKYVLSPLLLGLDASLYSAAAATWINGGNPWMISQHGVFYAAPPPSLLPYLPFAWMPAGLVSLIWVVGSFALGFLAIRTLRLPWWWMAFPPLVDGILVGNANVAVLALLVAPASRLGPLAAFLKIYALVPMIGERRWRDLAVTAALLAATAIILPWSSWFAQLDFIGANLERTSSTTSVFGHPILMAIAAIALLSLGLRRAGWLAVPLLWPHTQLHYAAISVPGLTRYLALAWCYPVPELWVAATVALAIYERAQPRPP